MALQNIIDKILLQSREEADRLKAEADAEADKTIRQGQKAADAEKEQLIADARERMENERRRKLALVNLESRKEILTRRCALIDGVFQNVTRQLQELRGEKHRKLVLALLSDFVPEASCQVLCHKADVDKYTILLSSIWGGAMARFCRIKGLDENLGGGFILRSQRMVYDCTFKRLVQEQREILEPDVVKVLFPAMYNDGTGDSTEK